MRRLFLLKKTNRPNLTIADVIINKRNIITNEQLLFFRGGSNNRLTNSTSNTVIVDDNINTTQTVSANPQNHEDSDIPLD